MDQAGGDAEQLVAQSGGVRTSVLIDPGECLEQDREVPGHERSPHPHGVDGVVCGGELAQRGAEFGLTKAGHAMVAEIAPDSERTYTEIEQIVGIANVAQLYQVLDQVIQRLGEPSCDELGNE